MDVASVLYHRLLDVHEHPMLRTSLSSLLGAGSSLVRKADWRVVPEL